MLKHAFRRLFIHLGPLFIIRKLSSFLLGPTVTILYGHRVLENNIIANTNDLRSVAGQSSTDDIRKAISILSINYHFISIDEAMQQINSNSIKTNSLVLTFDDGFQDNFINLLPILKEFNIPAVFYVSTSVIGSNKSLWFQSIINYFSKLETNSIDCKFTQKTYDLSSPQKKLDAAFQFMRHLQKHYPPEQFHEIIDEVAGDKSLPDKDDLHMSWDDLKALTQEDLITIGAHGAHHFPLNLCSADLAKTEIISSISLLEKNLGIKIKHFSYPRGHKEDFNNEHISQIKQAGIRSAVTTIRGFNKANRDVYRLKRIGLPPNIHSNTTEFLWYVAAIPQILQRIKSKFTRKRPRFPND